MTGTCWDFGHRKPHAWSRTRCSCRRTARSRRSGMLDGTAPGSRGPRGLSGVSFAAPLSHGVLVVAGDRRTGGARADDMVKGRRENSRLVTQARCSGSIQLRVAEAAAERRNRARHFDRHLEEADRGCALEKKSAMSIFRNRFMASHMIRIARDAIDRLLRWHGSGWIFDDHGAQHRVPGCDCWRDASRHEFRHKRKDLCAQSWAAAKP